MGFFTCVVSEIYIRLKISRTVKEKGLRLKVYMEFMMKIIIPVHKHLIESLDACSLAAVELDTSTFEQETRERENELPLFHVKGGGVCFQSVRCRDNN